MGANQSGHAADPEQEARRRLAGAQRIVVLTGAGVSADSGVPTFRGPDGLWRRYRPEELATPEAFARDPQLVWEWYDWRRAKIGACRPNAAHLALARLALRRPGVTLVTQNVDGLHEAAARQLAADPAADGALPLELHGSLMRVRCSGCGDRRPDREPVATGSVEELPHCGACGSLLRPDVVWFGEPLDHELLERAMAAAAAADVALVVGTSAVVYPAAGVAMEAIRAGAFLVEVNPEPTPLTPHADVALAGGAVAIVPRILDP